MAEWHVIFPLLLLLLSVSNAQRKRDKAANLPDATAYPPSPGHGSTSPKTSPGHGSTSPKTSPGKPSGGLGFDDPMKNKNKQEGDCSERSSCKNVASRMLSHKELEVRNCFCDDLCQTYNDCCRDHIRQPESFIETVTIHPEVIACQPLGIKYKVKEGSVWYTVSASAAHKKVYVVNRCPTNYSEAFIRDKCELGNSDAADTFFKIPVNGLKSRVLYLNYYCAICNGDQSVLFWVGERDVCRQSTIDPHKPTSNESLTDMIRNSVGCEVTFEFKDEFKPRPCKDVIRQCSKDWTDRKTAKKCQDRSQLTSFVYQGSQAVFRNKQCASCNFVEETQTVCIDPYDGRDENPPYNPSYTILIDLNSKFMQYRGMSGPARETTAVEIRECDLGFVYDPFSEICRPVYCRKGFQLTDHGCQPPGFDPGPPVMEPSTNETLLRGSGYSPLDINVHCNQTDLIISLNQSEYQILSNQSVIIHKMGVMYDKDEYVLDPPLLYICAPFTSRFYNETITNTILMFQFDPLQSLLSYVGVIVSLSALLIQFVIYMIFPILRNTPGKCVISLIASLFVGQLSFLLVSYPVRDWSSHWNPFCFGLAAIMHFGFLGSFFWMNVIAFDICRTFTSEVAYSGSSSRSRRFFFYSMYAWLASAVIVGLCIAMDLLQLDEDFRPHYGEVICWITSRMAMLLFFAVPLGVILIVNFVLFCVTVNYICRASRAAQPAVLKAQSKGQFILYVKLSFIIGLTWVFGFMATLTESPVLWYLFIAFNALQGAFLCIIFICTKKVYRLMKTKWSTRPTTSGSAQDNHKPQVSSKDTVVQHDSSKVVSKETCM